MRVVVVGTGHVGLLTAATLASLDHDVVGLDEDEEKIGQLEHGVTPFYEPGLLDLMEDGSSSGHLRFEVEPAGAVPKADILFICVGTPARASGEANLASVERSARSLARHLSGPVVVVEKSTVPAGTADRLWNVLRRERQDLVDEIEVVSNPEFLREGQGVEDSLRPSRILVGARSVRGFEAMRRLYEPLTSEGIRLIETDIATAELAKHACNAFLALKISYANALARLCERAGADVAAVADVMGSDPRIGRAYLDAGLGYGGYCFPKDLQAFERLAARLGYDFPLIREVARINDEAVHATVEKVKDALWNLEDRGAMMIDPGTRVYRGMIVGEHTRDNDLEVNVLKGKKLTNIRTTSKDEAVRLTPPLRMTLERALAYIEDDELVEVTPKSIRLRKRHLDPNERKKAERLRVAEDVA